MLNKMNSKRLFLLASTATLFFAAGQLSAETQYIKYKNYLIPIVSDEPEPNLIPNVYYIDDVADSRKEFTKQDGTVTNVDANGVYELPIVVGWHKLEYYNLVGIGAAGLDGSNFASERTFIQNMLSLMDVSVEELKVLVGSNLKNSIIEKALLLGTESNPLVIAIGGSREIVRDAIIDAAAEGTPINNKIRVIGVQSCDEGKQEDLTNCPDRSVDEASDGIEQALGNKFDIVSCSTSSSKSCRAFYNEDFNFSLAKDSNFIGTEWDDLDDWYKKVYGLTDIGKYIMGNPEVTSSLEHELGESEEGLIVKIADFTALAYLLWGDDAWSTQNNFNMFEEIQDAMAKLP